MLGIYEENTVDKKEKIYTQTTERGMNTGQSDQTCKTDRTQVGVLGKKDLTFSS